MNCLRLAAIWGYVFLYPGCSQAQIACGLGVHRSSVLRSLPMMEQEGLLLWENRNGRIYPYRVSGIRNVACI